MAHVHHARVERVAGARRAHLEVAGYTGDAHRAGELAPLTVEQPFLDCLARDDALLQGERGVRALTLVRQALLDEC